MSVAAAPESDSSPDLQWRVGLPAYDLHPVVGADSQLYSAVDVKGWAGAATPGLPVIPYTTTLVALPPDVSVQVAYTMTGESVIPLSAPIEPASEPVLRNATDGSPQVSTTWVRDQLIYQGDMPFPSDLVTFAEIGIFRGLRLGRLTVYPFRYDPADQSLITVDEVVVNLRFESAYGVLSQVSVDLDPLQESLRSLVLNPDQLQGDFVRDRQVDADALVAAELITDTVQFSIEAAGLYAMPWQVLVDAGTVPVDGDPAFVHIRSATTATEIALGWESDREQFVFYVEPTPSRWADYEVYRVSYDATPGVRMGTRPCEYSSPYKVYLPLTAAASGTQSASPATHVWVTVSAEENHRYDSLYVSPRDGQSWYWACLQEPSSAACPAEMSHEVSVSAPSKAGMAELELWVQGYTRTEHQIRVLINGQSVGTVQWFGKQALSQSLWFPASYLQADENLIRFERVGDNIGGAWIDGYALRHDIERVEGLPLRFSGQDAYHTYALRGVEDGTELYDITTPNQPELLVGCGWDDQELRVADSLAGPRTYLLVTRADISSISSFRPVLQLPDPEGVDYLAIAPQAWLDALQPLLDHRESQGLTTFAAPLEAIYDLYGDGRQSPEAIRAFISHAYHTWTPRPLYVLLVGDGTWDPLNYMGTDTLTWLPPYLVDVDPWMGEVPADNRYAAVDGDDALPDVALGRLPVNSLAELTATVDKMLTYEHDTDDSLWKVRHLFVVDDSDGVNDFSGSADVAASWAPPTHTISTLEMPNADVEALDSQRASLFSYLNQGALVVNWLGHSSWQQWEHRRLFHTDDLAQLSSSNRLPLVLEMTCFTSNFAHPESQHTALDEALVRLPGAGAVATWGSSGGGLDDAHQLLHAGFYQALFGQDTPSLGQAAIAAKLTAPADANYLVDTFHLFGDPALSLPRSARPQVLYIPVISSGGHVRLYLPSVFR